jgi:hypothetical protein
MTTGILMIALGHENYIKMAVNLAASIRATSQVNIHLVHDGKLSELSEAEQTLFTSDSLPDNRHWHTGQSEDPVKAKTRLYDLSPYDRTLFLDVDMIWLFRPIDELINELEGVDFAIMNEGPIEKCYWADPAEMRTVTGSEVPMHVFYSELLYFEKSDQMKAYFKSVKANYDKPRVRSKEFAGSHMPDELAYIMASLQTGILPHAANWFPVYWYLRDKANRHLQPYQLSNIFYAYSIGGNVTPQYAKAHYNNLSTHFASKMGIKKPYQVRDKRSYIATRQKY